VVLWIVGWTKLKYFRLYMVVYGIMRKKLSLPKKPSSHTTYLECPTGLIQGHLKAYPRYLNSQKRCYEGYVRIPSQKSQNKALGRQLKSLHVHNDGIGDKDDTR